MWFRFCLRFRGLGFGWTLPGGLKTFCVRIYTYIWLYVSVGLPVLWEKHFHNIFGKRNFDQLSSKTCRTPSIPNTI